MIIVDYLLKTILYFIFLFATWVVLGFLMNDYNVQQWEMLTRAFMLIVPGVIAVLIKV